MGLVNSRVGFGPGTHSAVNCCSSLLAIVAKANVDQVVHHCTISRRCSSLEIASPTDSPSIDHATLHIEDNAESSIADIAVRVAIGGYFHC